MVCVGLVDVSFDVLDADNVVAVVEFAVGAPVGEPLAFVGACLFALLAGAVVVLRGLRSSFLLPW